MKKVLMWTGMLGGVALLLFVGYFLEKFGHETERLVDYHPSLTTHIYDRNGEKIANIFEGQNRIYAPFDTIPPQVIEALLAIEDTTFFEHYGINIDAIFRAVIKDVKAGKLVEGASTITQQLVKNTLLTREKKFSRKLKELIFSLKLETELSKEEILERYFNAIYLGHGYYGIRTAALGYFHKPLDRLTLKETAILVGLPKAPSFYAPTRNYELSLGRANRVITRMYSLGWIDEAAYQAALDERPEVFDETLTQNRAPYVVDEVLRRAEKLYPDIRTGGYTIETTVDIRLQKAGRKALRYAYEKIVERAEQAKDINESRIDQLNGALVSLDPEDGEVLALVGGVDYAKSAFNRATQARRQPGSAFKPFIYQSALDLGYSGATELVDIARTYDYETEGSDKKWQPKNYERDYKGLIKLREALIHSRNLATINLVTDIGLSRMLKELSRYGFEALPRDLSLSLGSITLSPLDLAGFYTSFAAGGIQSRPYLIRSIASDDRQLYQAVPERKQVTSPQQAFLMTTILRDVVKRGTGRAARVRGMEVAGKTGTTNKSIDAWFAGYSPSVETVVWFGNDDNTPLRRRETGGRASAPAFREYMQQLLRLDPQVPRKFSMPEGVVEVDQNGQKEYFTKESPPPRQQRTVEAEDSLLF